MQTSRIWLWSVIGVLALGIYWTGARSQGQGSADKPIVSNKLPAGKKIVKVVKTEAEWQKLLTPEQYRILRQKGTERAFSGDYDNHEKGTYLCAGCGIDLFSSETKFDSGTGWPSFYKPIENHITTEVDSSLFTTRTEVLCARCGGHLGHVFDDGPKPTGLRYCMNAGAMQFEKAQTKEQPKAAAKADDSKEQAKAAVKPEAPKKLAKATFGAGCFWGVEATFRKVEGVSNTAVGFLGGTMKNPTYEDVCRGTTGHAEVVEVEYDPSQVTYDQLLDVFWENHDPTTLNRQGPDVGDQYRSAIFFHTPEQEAAAKASMASLQKSSKVRDPIVTEITPVSTFYKAEEYHQQYLEKKGLASCHVGLR